MAIYNCDSDVIGSLQADKRWAASILAMMWLSVIFVIVVVLPFASSDLIWAMVIGGGLVLVLNSMSILGFYKSTRPNRETVYGLRVGVLDQLRK